MTLNDLSLCQITEYFFSAFLYFNYKSNRGNILKEFPAVFSKDYFCTYVFFSQSAKIASFVSGMSCLLENFDARTYTKIEICLEFSFCYCIVV